MPTTDLAPLSPTHDLSHLLGALRRVPERRRRTAVDGGAHTGAWTSVLASEFDEVVAFEPVDRYAEMIEQRPNVTVHRVAIGANIMQCAMEAGEENAGQSHVVSGTDTWVVPLDAFGLTDLDFLKLDVEGLEQPALEGARETIERCRPWVMIERNELARDYYGADPDGAHKRLRQWGYRAMGQWNKDYLYAP